MRHLTADLILTPDGTLEPNLVVTINDNGVVVGLTKDLNSSVETYQGMLLPGLINAHCHLELSNMKGVIPPKEGLTDFLRNIIQCRKSSISEEQSAAREWDAKMWEHGIQAVGDICNNDVTFPVKSVSNIRYHNLIEQFGLEAAVASKRFQQSVQLHAKAKISSMSASIVPHAPYSVSDPLYDHIKESFDPENDIWSIHYLESESEQEFVSHARGSMMEMYLALGILPKDYVVSKESVTEKILRHMPASGKVLLVHNTYITAQDIDLLKHSGRFHDMWFCLCPSANVYIENRLPDVPMMRQQGCQLVIGTDSLASNQELSIVHEVAVLQQAFPEIPSAEIWTWATANGARLFGWSDLGTFEKGSSPGVINIRGDEIHRIL